MFPQNFENNDQTSLGFRYDVLNQINESLDQFRMTEAIGGAQQSRDSEVNLTSNVEDLIPSQPSHPQYIQTLLSKGFKSLQIFRLQRQIEEFYTEKIQSKCAQKYFVEWIDLWQDQVRSRQLMKQDQEVNDTLEYSHDVEDDLPGKLPKATEALPEAEQSLELNELTSHLLSQMEQTLQTPLIGLETENFDKNVDQATEKR